MHDNDAIAFGQDEVRSNPKPSFGRKVLQPFSFADLNPGAGAAAVPPMINTEPPPFSLLLLPFPHSPPSITPRDPRFFFSAPPRSFFVALRPCLGGGAAGYWVGF